MSSALHPSLAELEQALAGVIFPREPGPLPGVDDERRALYRRLVRSGLFGAVRKALPLTRARLGDEALDRFVETWLQEEPPRVRRLREVTTAFGAWMAARNDLSHPAVGELVHWEVLELEVLQAPDADPSSVDAPAPEPEPADECGVEPDPSARLVAYRHAVHRMDEGSPWPEPAATPWLLLAHRVDEARAVVELSAPAARLLALTAEGATIGAALSDLEAEAAGLDREAARELLRELRRRGALRGFPPRAAVASGAAGR